MIDFTTLLIGFGLMLTGALFFGYPIGLKHGAKMVADQICKKTDEEPWLVRDARRRLDRRNVLNAEVIE
jgi:hypothetical protein